MISKVQNKQKERSHLTLSEVTGSPKVIDLESGESGENSELVSLNRQFVIIQVKEDLL